MPLIFPKSTTATTTTTTMALLALSSANNLLAVPLLAFSPSSRYQHQFCRATFTFATFACLDSIHSPSTTWPSFLSIRRSRSSGGSCRSCYHHHRSSSSKVARRFFGHGSGPSSSNCCFCLFAASSSNSNPSNRRRVAAAAAPSTVVDPHGPTPHREADPFPEIIDLDSLPEAHYDPDNHPVPHQPWRRGDTDGCHDPICAPWRLEAEAIISDAARLVGCDVVDVTWYMAQCVVGLDDSDGFRSVVPYVDGPEVRIEYPDLEDDHVFSANNNNAFVDPEAGTDQEILTEEDELLDYEQYDEDAEYELLASRMPPHEYDDDDHDHPPPRREPRSRVERVLEVQEERESRRRRRMEEEEDGGILLGAMTEKPEDGTFSHPVNTKALSVVSQAILRALAEPDVEDRLQILSRHEIILTSPLDCPVILDSQKEFDAARDLDVYVETRDPWGSNRVLGGKLVDRNAMDVIINQDNSGRMVTIPNSMIHQVLLPSGLATGSARMKAGMDGIVRGEEEEEEEDEEDDDGVDYGDDDEDGDEEEYLDVEEEEVFE